MTAQYYSCDLNTTPSRKRKRQHENFEEHKEIPEQTAAAPISCFTNAAFCSTPKKIVARRRFQINKNKENIKVISNVCPEPKTIVENNEKLADTSKTPQNPYEVLRKPPKKKKRHCEELVCFENHGLNLDLPEKLFNPYEVVRKITDDKKSNCFSNPALNLKVHDASIFGNPFEVQRQAKIGESVNNEFNIVCKNPFVTTPEAKKVLSPKPCQLKLGLPFKPKLGCRIDFNDVSISQLTPSKLLAEKLVFSPVQKAKLSLDSIGEESPLDIGKELDRYQLELENSINEAKLQKTGIAKDNVAFAPQDSDFEIKLHFKQKTKFIQKLYGIPEQVESKQIIEETPERTESFDPNVVGEQNRSSFENEVGGQIDFEYNLNEKYQKTETAEVIAIENLDELYGYSAEDKEDSFDFKPPATFVRAYTRQETTSLTVSKESLNPSKGYKSNENEKDIKKLENVKNIIRKSIRKLVNTHQHSQLEKMVEGKPNKEIEQKGFINAIRSSFRRKPVMKPEDHESKVKNEISIIDCSERTMKLKSDILCGECTNVDNLTNEIKPNLRSSIRKSTREVRNQLLKSVFHKKHEEYDLQK